MSHIDSIPDFILGWTLKSVYTEILLTSVRTFPQVTRRIGLYVWCQPAQYLKDVREKTLHSRLTTEIHRFMEDSTTCLSAQFIQGVYLVPADLYRQCNITWHGA